MAGEMRHFHLLFWLLLLAVAGQARAQNRWERLPPTPALPKPVRSGLVAVNRIRLWYAVFGRGRAVILLHGGLANSNYWGGQIPALASRYKVIVIDSRGHGRSTWDGGPVSYHLMASDVLALMDELHIAQAALVGWSDGAIIGIDIAIHHPERLTRLFAFGANSDPSGAKSAGDNPAFADYRKRTRDEYARLSPAPGQFDAFHEQLDRMWNAEPRFSDDQLRSIAVPTWIVDGEHDEIIRREDTDRMARLIRGAHEVILPGVSHFAFLQNPEQFNQALLRFLAGD